MSKAGVSLINGRLKAENITPNIEPVLCKGLDGAVSSPSHSVLAKTNYKTINAYNNSLCKSSVSIGGIAVNNVEKVGCRIFADRSCKADGRIYGALHQRVRKELRRAILIDGKKTIEVDIKSTHPLIIYTKEGFDITSPQSGFRPVAATYSGNPYSVGALYSGTKADRNIIKSLMTRMLNLESNKDEDDDSFAKRVKASFDYSVRSYVQSSNEEKLERAAGMKGSLKEYGVAYSKEFGSKFDVVDVVLAILDRHKLIKHWFTSEAWKSLNKYESDILLKVVKHFVDKNIPILTIHDSVRIAEEHREELIDVYKCAIESVLDFEYFDKEKLVSVDEEQSSLLDDEIEKEIREIRLNNKIIDDWDKIRL